MDTARFDTIARLFASHRSRRAAIARGESGIFAAVRAAAQEATPAAPETPGVVDPLPGADSPTKPEFLFVQPFGGGTWAPKGGEEGTYTLTLSGATASTVYFSDRPERIFGTSPTQKFLDGLGFTPTNPPNAALVARHADGVDEDVLVIELFDPVYDAGAGTLTYDAKVLVDYGGEGLREAARKQADLEFPAEFAAGSLFIDDCALLCGRCYIPGEPVNIGSIRIPTCYTGEVCDACNTDLTSAEYGQACAEKYPQKCTYSATAGWNCHVAVAGIGGMC